ncbi:MAG: hypothetical protein R3D27_14880 [Hyphomicrobiaceae bacterium]
MSMEPAPTTPGDLTRHIARLDECAGRRNRIEYLVGGGAMVLLLATGAVGLASSQDTPAMITAIGSLILAGGLAVALSRLNRHAAAEHRRPPVTDAKRALIGRLRRERDLLRSVWSWYIGPMLPGFVLIWGGLIAGGSVGAALVGSLITIVAIAWIANANRRAAAGFDRQIRELAPSSR